MQNLVLIPLDFMWLTCSKREEIVIKLEYKKMIWKVLKVLAPLLLFSCPVCAETIAIVNKTDYTFTVIEDGNVVIHQRVIIGRQDRPTPIMRDVITDVIIAPTWTVPQKLARLDIVPKIQKDFGVVDRYGYTFFRGGQQIYQNDIEWGVLSDKTFIPFTIVQKPGLKNALGKIKFRLTNQHRIFIHGTPHKGLFNQNKREFSSGCIRLENEVELAQYLLPDKDIHELLSKYVSEKWFRLKYPLEVLVTSNISCIQEINQERLCNAR